ncbi:uncharacterized protein BO87DRAFT_382390 [Aspergillus neoniger CBS 115656]|uniref:Uncharacterized protein n=1 Tax=Aspergillus neoniger (strain CBS 115656) TaxID=1448310 RepID=A0A318YXI7_ASPNB|nr:hypothetical protein BO87DRAFT_382390 [Aspergillus neoniger CBS 115656]PYH39356.1 hypothetical protein BO87DRAFT_382390 [Aspergillus neoniger CBS 115656]
MGYGMKFLPESLYTNESLAILSGGFHVSDNIESGNAKTSRLCIDTPTSSLCHIQKAHSTFQPSLVQGSLLSNLSSHRTTPTPLTFRYCAGSPPFRMFHFKNIIVLLCLSCLFFKASLATSSANPTEVANVDDVVAGNTGTAAVNNPNEAFDDVDGNGMSMATTDVEEELNSVNTILFGWWDQC